MRTALSSSRLAATSRLARTPAASGVARVGGGRLAAPAHPASELRACFRAAGRVRGSARGAPIDAAAFRLWFGTVCMDALDAVDRDAEGDDAVLPTINDQWIETFDPPVASDDTLLIGLRADMSYDDVSEGRFEHRYFAWSKAEGRVAAHGGATIPAIAVDAGRRPSGGCTTSRSSLATAGPRARSSRFGAPPASRRATWPTTTSESAIFLEPLGYCGFDRAAGHGAQSLTAALLWLVPTVAVPVVPIVAAALVAAALVVHVVE